MVPNLVMVPNFGIVLAFVIIPDLAMVSNVEMITVFVKVTILVMVSNIRNSFEIRHGRLETGTKLLCFCRVLPIFYRRYS